MSHLMKLSSQLVAALFFLLFAVMNAWSRPAMSVLTINTPDPAAYVRWAKSSGPAIGKSIDAAVGGTCVPVAGYYAPGELYYWHLYGNHAAAMGSDPYNPTVMSELKKQTSDRVVSRSDAYSVLLSDPADYSVGDTFSNWNIVVSTSDPGEYLQSVKRMSAAASENGLEDIRLAVYSYLTGENAGKLMTVVQAPNGNRLGAMLDALESDWASAILNDMVSIRTYEHGFTMNCSMVFAATD